MLPERRNRLGLLTVLLVLLLILSRLLFLEADPPFWMPGAWITDEGWWGDSARGLFFFGDPFADDFGTSYLLCPGYTWSLALLFKTFGIGIFQLRLISALSGIFLVLGLSLFVGKKLSPRFVPFALLLGILDPCLIGHSRVALLEIPETLWIVLALLPLLPEKPRPWGPFYSGICLGIAFSIKPTAITFGFLPIGVVLLLRLLRSKTALREIVMFGLGTTALLGPLFLFHILPNWKPFIETLAAETATGKDQILDKLLYFGKFLNSTDDKGNFLLLWSAKASPAFLLLSWLGLLSLARRRDQFFKESPSSAKGPCAFLRNLGSMELGILAFVFFSFVAYHSERDQAHRRLALLVPGLSLLGVHWALNQKQHRETPFGPISLFALSLPLLLAFKGLALPRLLPWLLPDAMHQDIRTTSNLAGLLTLLLWPFLILPLLIWKEKLQALGAFVLGWGGKAFLTLALLFQMGLLMESAFYLRFDLVQEQKRLQTLVQPNETVLGDYASTLFYPIRVLTVRRVLPAAFSAPPPNLDVFERLQPRYLCENNIHGFQVFAPRYQDLEKKYLFHPLTEIRIGPYRGDKPRYLIKLLEREKK
jgi:4-amino-4-deoxy-L-arabinose transferase-like glycosyltransferase